MPNSSMGTDELIEGDPPETSNQSDDKSAESSSQAQEQDGESLIESVQDALKGSDKEASSTSSTGSADPAATQSQAAAEDPLGEITDQELSRYGPKTQRRIRQLLDVRASLNGEVEDLRPKAQHFDKIDEYIRTNGITNEDFSILLEIGSLVRNDPFKAYERLSAITNELAKVTGHQLPPEVAERVRLGYISEQDARELVQNRNRAALAEQRRQESETRSRDVDSQQRLHTHVQTCRQTANDWEARHQATDPDWKDKQGRIAELIKIEVFENGYPETQDKIVKMLDGFLTKVNGEFARFKPAPKEIRPAMGNSASSRANSSAAPKNFMEVVERALAQ